MAPYTKAKPAGTPTWVDLTTPNADAARSFYRTLFGWEYDIGGPEFGGYTTARLGQHSTAGLTEPPPGTPPMPASWNLYFASDDLDADVARAVALGATQLYPAMQIGEFGAMATLHDPTGAMFSFWKAGSHVGHQIDGQPGAVAWFELYSTDAKAARDFYTALLGATSEPQARRERAGRDHADRPVVGRIAEPVDDLFRRGRRRQGARDDHGTWRQSHERDRRLAVRAPCCGGRSGRRAVQDHPAACGGLTDVAMEIRRGQGPLQASPKRAVFHCSFSLRQSSRISALPASNASSRPCASTRPPLSTMIQSARCNAARRWDTARTVGRLNAEC
jgi:uncharacterized protein